MSTFDPKFAHDVLLPIAEAAYLANVQPNNLPANYSVVGQITADQAKVAAIAAIPQFQVQYVKLMAELQTAGNGFGWVVENKQDHTLVVSFRGTVSPDDWLHDLDAVPAPYEPVANFGVVHQGFQLVYLAVRNSVLTQLGKATKGFTRLILTGHSLGAAVSELAAPDLLRNAGLNVQPEVQNFAGPRAGHRDFASIFDVQIDVCFRVVNVWDIVPHVPPTLALYEHGGLAVRVDGGFTLDELVAHSMEKSYGPGLAKLPQAGAQIMAASAAAKLANSLFIGREP